MKKGAELALNFMLRLVFGMIAIFLINGYLQEKGLDACVRRNQCAECVDVWISRTTGCCIVVRRAGVFDGVKIHKDYIPGLSKRHK